MKQRIIRSLTALALTGSLSVFAMLGPAKAEAGSTAIAEQGIETVHTQGQALAENGFRDVPEAYKTPADHQGHIDTLEYVTGNRTKRALVYVPYGYTEDQQYNILYLMHGAWGNETTFFGKDPDKSILKNELDHLIENGEMQPILVVTPTYYAKKNFLPFLDTSEKDVKVFPRELVSDLMPAVETAYSTYAVTADEAGFQASRNHRAFGGFSMGAVTTWYIFEEHLAYFKNFIPCSGDSWTVKKFGGQSEPEETARILSESVARQGYTAEDFFICVATGTKDIAEPQLSAQIAAMRSMEVFQILGSDRGDGNTVYCLREGAYHDYPYIRLYLFNILPDLWP